LSAVFTLDGPLLGLDSSYSTTGGNWSLQVNGVPPPSYAFAEGGFMQYILEYSALSSQVGFTVEYWWMGGMLFDLGSPHFGSLPPNDLVSGLSFTIFVQTNSTGNAVISGDRITTADGSLVDSYSVDMRKTVNGKCGCSNSNRYLTPIVAFTEVMVGYGNGSHTMFSSIDAVFSWTAASPLAVSSIIGGAGLSESSNAAYLLPAEANNLISQTVIKCNYGGVYQGC